MEHIENVKEIVNQTIEELNAFLVDFSLNGNKLRVQVDTLKGISIQECRKINKAIDAYLIEEELDWGVEVGSPGLTEAFSTIQQYHKNIGREVEIKTVDGEKFKGELKAVNKDGVMIEWRQKVRDEKSKKKNWKMFTASLTFDENDEFKQIKETKVVISFK